MRVTDPSGASVMSVPPGNLNLLPAEEEPLLFFSVMLLEPTFTRTIILPIGIFVLLRPVRSTFADELTRSTVDEAGIAKLSV